MDNLNAIWKIISQWDLMPSNAGTLLSLGQLVKSKLITPDMLINHETGKPIEYYPATSNDGDHFVLISHGKHGMNVVGVAGQGLWIDDKTAHDADSVGYRQIMWTIGIGLVTALLAIFYWISGRVQAKPD